MCGERLDFAIIESVHRVRLIVKCMVSDVSRKHLRKICTNRDVTDMLVLIRFCGPRIEDMGDP